MFNVDMLICLAEWDIHFKVKVKVKVKVTSVQRRLRS